MTVLCICMRGPVLSDNAPTDNILRVALCDTAQACTKHVMADRQDTRPAKAHLQQLCAAKPVD